MHHISTFDMGMTTGVYNNQGDIRARTADRAGTPAKTLTEADHSSQPGRDRIQVTISVSAEPEKPYFDT